jgi:phage terminase small subunit
MKRKSLTPRQVKFVAAYIEGHGGAESARLAGYSPASSRNRACELLNENETVMAAISEAQAALRKEANYNAEKSMVELDEKIKQATEAKQYSAVARLVELKMKLAGLLTEKKDAPAANFMININGIDDTPAISPVIALPRADSIYD